MRNKIRLAAFKATSFIFSFSFAVYRQKTASDRIFVLQRNKASYFCREIKN